MDDFNENLNENFNEGFDDDTPIVLKMDNVRGIFETQIISKSFIFMFVALLISAFAAFSINSLGISTFLLLGKGIYISFILQIGAAIGGKYAINKDDPTLVCVFYVAYAYLTGINLETLFATTSNMVVSTCLITAFLFIIMAFYGMVTDKNMGSVGTLLLMTSIGVILVVVVNVFIVDGGVANIIVNSVGVLFFVGMTAYDMYNIKNRMQQAKAENILVLALYGGFEIYIDFITMFIHMLGLLDRRGRRSRWSDFFRRY